MTLSGLALIADIAERYNISAVGPLLRTCHSLEQERTVRIAVLGRFKAGKSSFLNRLLGRSEETARVQYLNGEWEEIFIDSIHSYISESENPENLKQVSLVAVELPGLKRFPNLCFVDTPGLESVFTHNTETALSWLPEAGLALVAIEVDPPLSERDIALIRTLYQFTPHVAVLVTKSDTLTTRELGQMGAFVNEQLLRHLNPPPRVFPYSVRSGHEDLRRQVEDELIAPAQREFAERQEAILNRKMSTLLRQCEDYLRLALKSAETLDSERGALKELVIGEREFLDETRLQLKLSARHAAASTRQIIEKQLQSADKPIEQRLLPEMESVYTAWTKSLAFLIESFQSWLEQSLGRELRAVSAEKHRPFLASVESTKGQRLLQDFKRRLSERTVRAFGVPLRTTEIHIEVKDPETPDVNIGRVFDHNWELLGVLVPMWLVKGLVRRRLLNERLPYEVFKNLARLTSQWTDSVNASIYDIEKQAEATRDSLETPQILADIERLAAIQRGIRDLP